MVKQVIPNGKKHNWILTSAPRLSKGSLNGLASGLLIRDCTIPLHRSRVGDNGRADGPRPIEDVDPNDCV